jgi:hypothetical protein
LVLNVTAIAPSGPGNLQVYGSTTGDCATSDIPTTSTVNFQPPQDTGNATIVPLTGFGLICIRDNGASVNVAVDVTGYITGNTTQDLVGAAARVLDTRPTSQTGSLQGPLPGGQVFSFATGLPAGTKVGLDITAVDPTAVGNLRVFPEPTQPLPGPPSAATVLSTYNTAVVNYIPGVDSGSYYVTQTGNNGRIDLYSDSSGTVNVVVDYSTTFAAASHVAVIPIPYRLFDSRPGGIAAGGTTPDITAAFSQVGSSFTPGSAVATIGSLSDINPATTGFEVAYPAGTAVPNTANINNYPSQIRENLAVIALNTNGAFVIGSTGSNTDSTYDASAYIS